MSYPSTAASKSFSETEIMEVSIRKDSMIRPAQHLYFWGTPGSAVYASQQGYSVWFWNKVVMMENMKEMEKDNKIILCLFNLCFVNYKVVYGVEERGKDILNFF